MIKEFKNGEEVELKSTYKIQMTSLTLFATHLGYAVSGKKFALDGTPRGFNFANDGVQGKTAKSFLSLASMQQLHNTNLGLGDLSEYDSQSEANEAMAEAVMLHQFHPEQILAAINIKLVDKTKFQELKDGTVTINDHQISIAE